MGSGLLPAGYTQMNYIATQSNSCIDTGFKWADNSKLEVLGGYMQFTAGFQNLFGSVAMFIQKSNEVPPALGTNTKINSSNYFQVGLSGLKSWFVVEQEAISQYGSDYVGGGVVATQTGHVGNSNANVGLFARIKDNGTYDYPAVHFAIYRCRHTRNGILIQDLVPAKRNNDNELGFYDVVNNTFLTNIGSGTLYGG
jgi:hypothetical protein